MIDPASQATLKAEIAACIQADKQVLETLRAEVRPLRSQTRRVQSRSTTSISLVGTDGGNNQLQFDPFLIQLVRVVDSSNNEYCLEAVSPTTPIEVLSRRQFTAENLPATALGHLMSAVGATTLPQLSHMIRPAASGAPVSPSWVQVYRFGGIRDRQVPVREIILESLRLGGWRTKTLLPAGTASGGRRQADSFLRTRTRPIEECDVWANVA